MEYRHLSYTAALLACILFTACSEPRDSASNDTRYRNLDPSVKYVGQETCGTCHVDKFDTFTDAQMGRSFKPARPEHSAAEWDDVDPVYDEALDMYYQAFRRGEELFIMEYRLADGDTVHKRTEKIDFIVGSGQHTNSHIMSVNGYLYQMPMTWYAQDGHWSLAPKFDGGNNYRFSRPITEPCMTCHNAIPGFVDGSENKFTDVPHGIDCERCHGPGELHVEEKRAGIIVDTATEIDYSIVNPAKLPLDRQFDVCQRCHMQGATVYLDGADPDDFKPGMTLSDVMNVFWPRYADSTTRFIMASHPDRLKMSDCFRGSYREESVEGMTCNTCHDPHLPIEALGADHYRDVCQSCHVKDHNEPVMATLVSAPPQASPITTCTAPLELREEVNNDCVSCHMPVSGSDDIPHVRVTDHFIRVVEPPTAGVDEKLAGGGVDEPMQRPEQSHFVGMAGLIEAEPSEREMAEGYMTYFEELSNVPYFLDSAAAHLSRARRVEPIEELAPSLVRLFYLQRDYDALVRLSREVDRDDITEAWTLYRIGEAYEKTGDVHTASTYFEGAVREAPYHLRFINRLGMSYVSTQRFDLAVSIFDRLLSENPKYGDGYNNRGFARAMQGDAKGAEEDFKRAIALNPDETQALANIASLYLNTGRAEDARTYARRLRELEPGNENYQRLWDLVQ